MTDEKTRPSGPPLRTSRSRSRPDMSTAAPLSTCPNTFSVWFTVNTESELRGCTKKCKCIKGREPDLPSGTSQFSKTSSQVSLPRMPTLSSFWCVENPLKVFSTMKAVIPLDPFSGEVFAYTTNVEAIGPFVILATPEKVAITASASCHTPAPLSILSHEGEMQNTALTKTYSHSTSTHPPPSPPSTSYSQHHSPRPAHSSPTHPPSPHSPTPANTSSSAPPSHVYESD